MRRRAKEAWDGLQAEARAGGDPPAFDPASLDGLPDPARRLLGRALPPGAPLRSAVELRMEGSIRLRRWTPFTASEVLVAGKGFLWSVEARMGHLPVSGSDVLVDHRAQADFRVLGVAPVMRSSGPDVDRSAWGRMAAEVVMWLPQALAPQRGARWRPVDDEFATVTLPFEPEPVDVHVHVEEDGRLSGVWLPRWGNPGGKPYDHHPFGGTADEELEVDGVRIGSAGTVGWWWDSPRWEEGEFFRFRLTSARFL